MEGKYISPSYLLEWIKNPWKSIKNVFDQWKDLVLAFLVNGGSLAWKVGYGEQVRIGENFVMGWGDSIF